jgi:HrpA-like RNA helicase
MDEERRLAVLKRDWISQASAKQRKGRAGRTKPGHVYRMYKEEESQGMKAYTDPQVGVTRLWAAVAASLCLYWRFCCCTPEAGHAVTHMQAPPHRVGMGAPPLQVLHTPAEGILLRILAAGVLCPSAYPLLTHIPPAAAHDGMQLLQWLGFVVKSAGSQDWELTTDGKVAAGLQLDPRQARFLLTAASLGCGSEAAHIVALMQVGVHMHGL